MRILRNDQLDDSQARWPQHMRLALGAAARVLTAAPNPRVGCVLVTGDAGERDEVIGTGWHSGAGLPHAEPEALADAAGRAQGATAFVTLEPCCHTGRTGPCSEALISAGVRRVVIALRDSNPRVDGGGIAALEAAGIDVVLLEDFSADARRLNRGFCKRQETGRPFVRCKLAMSLDGRTGLANGESKWITSDAARADVQRLRAESDAIITGIETVLADDPALTLRPESLPLSPQERKDNARVLEAQPLRVILDSRNRLRPDAAVVTGPGRCVAFAVARGSLESAAVETRVCGTGERVSLPSVLDSLALQDECNEVLVEAGATLSSAFIEAGLVDELIVYIAPKLLGSDARPLLALAGLTRMSEAVDFEIASMAQIGPDIRVVLHPRVR